MGFASGISIRRIIPSSIDGNPRGITNFHERMHDWSYIIPVRVTTFHLENGRQLTCSVACQIQIREMHEPLPNMDWYNVSSQVNKLYSVGVCTAYMFAAVR